MYRRFASVPVLALVVALGLAFPVRAQMMDRVVAVVNDEAISYRDLVARIRLAMVSSNLPDTPESRQRALPQVLRKMVDERLQMQEAQRLNVVLSNADIDDNIALIERQSRLPKGALLGGLAQQGVDVTRVRDQIRADLTWIRLVGRVVSPQIRVGDEEVSDRLQSLTERQGLRESRVAEIFLPVDSADQEAEARQLGEKLLDSLRQGTSFPALARQFSRSPTSSNGGLLGWVSQGMVDEELEGALSSLDKGQTSPLVRTAGGFYILSVLDTRVVGQSINPEDSTVTLARLLLPTPSGAPPKMELMERAYALTRPAKTCADLDAVAAKGGGAVAARQGPGRLGEVEPVLRQAVMPLAVNQTSNPLDVPEGIVVVMVCGREDALLAAPPSREQVRRQIEDERRDMLARRYLRDLRRAAFIDVRR